MRSYGEFCALAQALDVVGERWTLLIVRELLIQDRARYTDLQDGLPGIATNLLANRLRQLEEAGLVEREVAPPPIAATLFRLTERGKELRPVIEALTRWGVPMVARPIGSEAFRSHWLKLPLELYLRDRVPEQPRVAIGIRTGEEPMRLDTVEGRVEIKRGLVEAPDATVEGSASLILGYMLGVLDLAEARKRGLKVTGDLAALDRVRGGAAAA